jgi:NADH:ubiquinone oxidoreductase subunit H
MNNKTVLICLVWLTVLAIWVTSRIEGAIDRAGSPPIQTIGLADAIQTIEKEYVVPVGNNTVWIIDPTNAVEITVITHDRTGYHAKVVKLDYGQ